MSAHDRLAQIRPKIERAKKHVGCLEREISDFLKADPYKVGAKRDAQSRKLTYYLTSVDGVPSSVSLITGDVIQCLMSALDHLAYQIVCSDTFDKPPNPNWIYFPVADDAAKYEAKKMGKIQGALQPTISAIDAIKPYRGGNDLLWSLYRLNNIEKHRLLITVGSAFRSVDLGAHVSSMMKNAFGGTSTMGEFPILSAFFKPADKMFPLKAGDELFIDAPNAEVNEHLKFRFDVALSEPQVIETESILELVHQSVGLVEGIVSALTPRLV